MLLVNFKKSFLVVFLATLLVLFSLSSHAQTCGELFKSWGQISYQESLRRYSQLQEEASNSFYKKVEQGTISIEEVIGYLDSQILGKEKLAPKIEKFLANKRAYRSTLQRLFIPTVQAKNGRLILASDLRSEQEVKSFITILLQTLYQLEKNDLKIKIYKLFPDIQERTTQLAILDSFYYQNYDLFKEFIRYARFDAISSQPILGSILNFFFVVGPDPILSHRLNLQDLKRFRTTDLAKSLKWRLYAPTMVSHVGKRVLFAALTASLIALPIKLPQALDTGKVMISMVQDMDISQMKADLEKRVETQFQVELKTQILQLESQRAQEVLNHNTKAVQEIDEQLEIYKSYRNQ